MNNLLESLSKNKEINNSNLYFYIDHYKNKEDLKSNQEVIEIAKEFDKASSISVITSNSNLGLKRIFYEVLTKHFKNIMKEFFLVLVVIFFF